MRLMNRIGPCVATLSLAACTTVGVVGYPAEYLAINSPNHVWVTEPDNSVVDLHNPQVHGDTLAGFSNGGYVEMPITSVRLMKAEFSSPTRTAILAGTSAIVAAIAVSSLMGGGSGSTCYNRDTGGVMPCPPPAP